MMAFLSKCARLEIRQSPPQEESAAAPYFF
jgi:hypothetical protein